MPAEGEAGAAAMDGLDAEDDSPQQFCLRWNNYLSNLATCFDRLLQTESFVDVTLACEGQSLKAHKVVLSACSPYFQMLLMDNPCRHPIIIMRDIKYCDLKAVVDFIYRGEINVSQDQIDPLLKVAEMLKIRGLTDVSGEQTVLRAEAPPRAPKRPSSRDAGSPPKGRRRQPATSANPSPGPSPQRSPTASTTVESPPPHQAAAAAAHAQPPQVHSDDIDIRPGIAEMIREEERAKLLESSQAWLGASTSSISADSYQYQLQSMWQKCWSTNQSLVHNLRFRERGPLKSWRPETMAEAIFSVLKEGLSLSQAARKYDIPYPTFVLYANRVHNMLGPSADGGADLRPKGRGRPQRILLGVWPDEHIRGVIRAVVFRDGQAAHTAHVKEEAMPVYPSLADGIGVPNAFNVSGGSVVCGNGREGGVSPNVAAAAAVAAVAHGLRRQMCNMVAAAQRPPDHGHPHLGLPSTAAAAAAAAGLQMPMPQSPLSAGNHSPLSSTPPTGLTLEPPKQQDPFRPFASPRSDARYYDREPSIDMSSSNMGPSNMGPSNMGHSNVGPSNVGPPNMGPSNMCSSNMGPSNMGPPNMAPPKTPMSKNGKEQMSVPGSASGPVGGLPAPVKLEPPTSEARGEHI